MSYLRNVGRALIGRPPVLAGKASTFGSMISRMMLGNPVWSKRDFEQLADFGYRQNSVVARSVRMVAENTAGIPWLVYEGEGDDKREVPDHPVLKLLRHPNPMQDGSDFLQAVISHYLIAGNAFVERTDESDLGTMELYDHKPARMKVVPGPDGFPEAYEYRVNGAVRRIPVDIDNGQVPILHLKTFNPLDDWYGMSPLDPAAWAVDLHNGSQAWNKALLDNTGAPSGAFVYEGSDKVGNTLSDDAYERLKQQLDAEVMGKRNAGKPLLLEGGLKWQQFGLNPEQMQYIDAKNQSAREISYSLGVPPQLLGIPGDNTYGNYAEANRAFFRQTCIPLSTKLARTFSHWFRDQMDGARIEVDTDHIDALATEHTEKWQRINQSTVLTLNEKREALGYERKDGGDELYVGAGQIPIGQPDQGAIAGGGYDDETPSYGSRGLN